MSPAETSLLKTESLARTSSTRCTDDPYFVYEDPELGTLAVPRVRAFSENAAAAVENIQRLYYSKEHPHGTPYTRRRRHSDTCDENAVFNIPAMPQKAGPSGPMWADRGLGAEVKAQAQERSLMAYQHRLYQTHINPIQPAHLFPYRKVPGNVENFSGGRRAIERYMQQAGYYRTGAPPQQTLLLGMRWYYPVNAH